MSTGFSTWLDTFVQEKGLDTEHLFENASADGVDNIIAVADVLHTIKSAPIAEQQKIKNNLAKIGFIVAVESLFAGKGLAS